MNSLELFVYSVGLTLLFLAVIHSIHTMFAVRKLSEDINKIRKQVEARKGEEEDFKEAMEFILEEVPHGERK